MSTVSVERHGVRGKAQWFYTVLASRFVSRAASKNMASMVRVPRLSVSPTPFLCSSTTELSNYYFISGKVEKQDGLSKSQGSKVRELHPPWRHPSLR